MPFSKKELETLMKAIERASKELRPQIGYLKIKEIRIGRSEVRIFCELDTKEGLKKILIKYDRERVWVEGPKWASIPLKNKVKHYLNNA